MRSTKRISAMSPDRGLREASQFDSPSQDKIVYAPGTLALSASDSPGRSPRVKREANNSPGVSPAVSVKRESSSQVRSSTHRTPKKRYSPEKSPDSPSPMKPKKMRPQRRASSKARTEASPSTPREQSDDLRMLNHILTCILSKLPPASLMAAGSTCKRWRDLAQMVWKRATGITITLDVKRNSQYVRHVLSRSPSLQTLCINIPKNESLNVDSIFEAVYNSKRKYGQLISVAIFGDNSCLREMSQEWIVKVMSVIPILRFKTIINPLNDRLLHLQSHEVSIQNSVNVLDLSGWNGITPKFLQCVLSAVGSSLTHLLLATCVGLPRHQVESFLSSLPKLELLDLGRTSLSKALQISNKSLRVVSLWGSKRVQELVLECPALEELNVNECQNLLSVKMSCPNLKKIYGQGCPAMQSIMPPKRYHYSR